ncbi:hypothetical protein ACQWHL_27870, partial [Salmonella enterica subsp. enterica serovar Infantis]
IVLFWNLWFCLFWLMLAFFVAMIVWVCCGFVFVFNIYSRMVLVLLVFEIINEVVGGIFIVVSWVFF